MLAVGRHSAAACGRFVRRAIRAGVQSDLELLYKVGTDLANSGQWPNWAPDSEFRAARDASAAERT